MDDSELVPASPPHPLPLSLAGETDGKQLATTIGRTNESYYGASYKMRPSRGMERWVLLQK